MEEGEDRGSRNQHNIRFYDQEYPQSGDLVMVGPNDLGRNKRSQRVRNYLQALGVWRSRRYILSDRGCIPTNEYTKHSKNHKMMKARKVGKIEICMAIRIDEEKGFIDLSKKRVMASDQTSIEEKYAKGKSVQALLRAVEEKTQESLQSLYNTIVYPLQKKYPHAADAFNEALK